MIMSLYKKVAITNRHIFAKKHEGDYAEYLGNLADYVDVIILREKDLTEEEYRKLAVSVLKKCEEKKADVVLHYFTDTALLLHAPGVHLPMDLFRRDHQKIAGLKYRGASVHSLEEAKEAQNLGATYITFSHVFETDCKKGLKPKGLEALRQVCREISIPVYALGGIRDENEEPVISAGAAGSCRMSDYMDRNDKEL